MRATITLLITALFFTTASTAQNETRFRSIANAGLLAGDAKPALQLQTLNGLQTQTWFFGAGLGLDHYRLRSVPVFGAVRKALSRKAKAAFLYLDAGYHWPWLMDEDKTAGVTDSHGGLYYDAGIGCRVPVSKESFLNFSVGYSMKKYETKEPSLIAIWPWMPNTLVRNNYADRRFALKMGLTF